MVNRAKKRSVEDGKAFLRERLIDVERQFRDDLERTRRSITHDPTMGDAVEDSWIALLRNYLPNRYCVAKAFAIDCEGKTTDQLDCLIYDAHFTPALFGKDRHLYVPAEAVYATFEIKQTVNAEYLKAAALKAGSLRSLRRTSAPIHTLGQWHKPTQGALCYSCRPVGDGLFLARWPWENFRKASETLRRWSAIRLSSNSGFWVS